MALLNLINRVFMAFVLLMAVSAIGVSLLALFLPYLVVDDAMLELDAMERSDDFSISSAAPAAIQSDNSPYELNTSISFPPLAETDTLNARVYTDGKLLLESDCLEDFQSPEEYAGSRSLGCLVTVPYNYASTQDYKVYAVLGSNGKEFLAGPVELSGDWSLYEKNFWGVSSTLVIVLIGVFVLILVPLTAYAAYLTTRTKHVSFFSGEYSLSSLAFPLSAARTMLQNFNSFILSPYFWFLEALGIAVMLLYMSVAAEIWKSETALVAFLFSGLMAFIIPYLWCLFLWYADFREREPLRILVTLFLWGALAGLMAIGFNSIAGAIFGLAGLGFISTFLLAPPLEEFYKGCGLCLLSEHHEFNSIEDGILFGFVIGMGFSFIENWLYMLSNPMGTSILGWLGLFILRAMVFSANHGFYTALTGAIIGWLAERRFHAPALGLIAGVPVAAFFHAMHNSGEMLISFLGAGGILLYCCFLIPLFDYGGVIGLLVLFAYVVLRKKTVSGIPSPRKSRR